MSKKLATARDIVFHVQTLKTATDGAADIIQEYFDAGVFADADLEMLEITAAQLAACITLLEQFGHFMGGEATAAANYRTTLNAVRRVTV